MKIQSILIHNLHILYSQPSQLKAYLVKRVIRGNINEAWLSLVIDKH